MAKTLNELSRDLVDFIVELQSNAHNSSGFTKQRYNNLKIEILDPRLTKTPQIKVTIGISEAIFNLVTLERISGSLGPDERYVLKWFSRDMIKNELKEVWETADKMVGKAQNPT